MRRCFGASVGGEPLRDLARDYGVSHTTLGRLDVSSFRQNATAAHFRHQQAELGLLAALRVLR